ncbi:NUDIX hydrolase [Nonomuraea diastatica]|uniref:NUDIX hydrolase n=1 Tax=Nonomuraea diastatica TaxID=1848329 RepID=UPI001C7063E6|nr:NUDIX domain-containing protein [Nonomuraea diastatica]
MTQPLPRTPGVELLDVHRLSLVETAAPRLSPDERAAMNHLWEEAVLANPSLFDGPVVACASLGWEGPHSLVVSWVRTTFRHHVLRRVMGSAAWLPSLFVAVVQPADDGRLLVGRMSRVTVAPGRWQLPGGSMEPPQGDEPLDVAALGRHAARELVEETGVDTSPEDLSLWLVTRGATGNVGVLFSAPSRPASFLRARFAALPAAEEDPEFDRIALVRSPAELGGPLVDYLEPIVRRCQRSGQITHMA